MNANTYTPELNVLDGTNVEGAFNTRRLCPSVPNEGDKPARDQKERKTTKPT
jgi:hypothetical protein